MFLMERKVCDFLSFACFCVIASVIVGCFSIVINNI